ncbi:MAG: Brix domain-containing protein [Candidatus Asgardarchaeia archaeon]
MGMLITTSRRPTRRVRTLARDLNRVIPNSIRINRGKMNLLQVLTYASRVGLDHVMVINTWKGNPGKMTFFKVKGQGYEMIPPLVYLKGVSLFREVTEEKLKKRATNIYLYLDSELDEWCLRGLVDVFHSNVVETFDFFPPVDSILRIDRYEEMYEMKFFSKVRGKLYVIGPILRGVFKDVIRSVG